jgi:hypothetical protein
MGNSEKRETLGYNIVQRQASEDKKQQGKLKDEHGHHRKNGMNAGAGICWK